jgi:hypothetical protein
MTAIFLDAVIDTLKLIPFLFVTYLIMEAFEARTADDTSQMLAKVGPFGPIVGAGVGLIPQCGFSAAASSLFAGGLISPGTLIAVFLSTSDEMLPIFLSEHVALSTLGRILAAKAAIAVITGLVIDMVIKLLKPKAPKHIHDLCEHDHCGCEEDHGGGFPAICRAALKHTLNITLFIFIITVALAFVVEGVGSNAIANFLANRPAFGVCLSALIGLIPNCAASVMLTQLYLSRLITAAQMIAGLSVGAGVGLLVLFRTNRPMKENIILTLVLYGAGVAWGLLFELLHLSF